MATTWLVSCSATASDVNGGTSQIVRSSGTDGIVNATVGLTKITSITGGWTAADIGHGIGVTGGFRLISAVQIQTTATVTTTASTTVTSSAAFTSSMVGQAITGPGINTNSVVTVFTNSSSITISIAASGGVGSGTATFYPCATTTGNVAMAAGTAKTWTVGGAWTTLFSSALSTGSPCLGGDTVYVGSGIYRQTGTCNLVSPTSTLSFIGDIDGSFTGTAPGETRISGATTNDYVLAAATLLTGNTKNFLSFTNIVFQSSGVVLATLGHDWTFTDCAFFSGAVGAILTQTVVTSTASNYLFDRCKLWSMGAIAVSITMPTNATADYDTNIVFRNSIIHATGNYGCVTVVGSLALADKGGGVIIRNCTLFGAIGFTASGTLVSTSIPCQIVNSVVTAPTCLSSGTVGAIVENFNLLFGATPRSSVAVGANSVSSTGLMTLFDVGQERIWDGMNRPTFTPVQDSIALGFGDDNTAPSVDFMERPRPAGPARITTIDQATSATATTLTDATAVWGINNLIGATIKITGGTGSGQVKTIKSHTASVITVFGNWQTTPDSTSTYTIYFGAPGESFTCTSGSVTTAVISTGTWVASMWVGFQYTVTSGTASGRTGAITASTGTTLTFPTGTALDSTSKVTLYRDTSETTVNKAAGALERHDTVGAETTLTDSGGIAWEIPGWGDQQVRIPVDTTSTTITIRCSFTADYGNTNKPQLSLLADGETGVAGQSVTATGTAGSGTFETLSLSPFTATASGWVVIQLVARSDKPTGRVVFDTISVT